MKDLPMNQPINKLSDVKFSVEALSLYIEKSMQAVTDTLLAEVPENRREAVRLRTMVSLIAYTTKKYGNPVLDAVRDKYPAETSMAESTLIEEYMSKVRDRNTRIDVSTTNLHTAKDGANEIPLSSSIRERFKHIQVPGSVEIGEFSTGLTEEKLADMMSIPKAEPEQGRTLRTIVSDRIINEKLSGVFGSDISMIAPQLQETVTPEQLFETLVKELGADGVALAATMGLPVDPEVAKQHGIDYRTLNVTPVAFDEIAGIPKPEM